MHDSGAHVWISYSPDLRNWGGHKLMLQARKGGWWDANKVGLSPPLIETQRGWLMIYHGVRHTAAGSLYRLGLALFSISTTRSSCLLRGDAWIFGPEAPYERAGRRPNVAFPCGYTSAPTATRFNLYYGAADTCIALATGSIRAAPRLARRAREAAGVANPANPSRRQSHRLPALGQLVALRCNVAPLAGRRRDRFRVEQRV